MNKTEKKQQRGEEKKFLITETAMNLFKEKGYEKVTVDMIVKDCETSKGSFYHHFQSKADILNEQFLIADNYYEDFYLTLSKELSPKKRCEVFIEEVYTYLEKTFGRDFLVIIYATSLQSEKHTYFRNLNRKLFVIYENLLQSLLEKYTTTINLPMLKQTFIQLTMGIIYFWCTQPPSISLKESAMPAIQHFLAAFE